MATTKFASLAVVAVLLLHASWCAEARHHVPEKCGDPRDHRCSSPPAVSPHHVPEKCGDPRDHRCSTPPSAVSPQDVGGGAPAVMVLTSFEQGGDGGGPAACDGQYHSNDGQIAALSTEWYAGGTRCNKHIRITSTQNGRTVTAEVVDEVDGSNTVATSKAVWDLFGLDTEIGEVSVTWLDD